MGRSASLPRIGAVAVIAAALVFVVAPVTAPRASADPSVTSTIAVGTNPKWAAVDPGTHNVYVANYNSGNVSVINGTSVIGTIQVAGLPDGVAVDPGTHTIYVASINGGPNGAGSVSIINGTSVTSTIPINGAQAVGVAVDPGTHKVYVTDGSLDGRVSVISGTDVTTIFTDPNPTGVAVDPTTHNIYVANGLGIDTGEVSVINGTTVTNKIPVGGNAAGIAVDPGTHNVYVSTSQSNGRLWVINGTTVSTVIPVGSYPDSVAVDPGTHTVYVTSSGSGTVSLIDGTHVTNTIAVGNAPTGVTVDPVTHIAYVANFNGGTVSVIDTGCTPSGPAWAAQFPTSTSVADLAQPFQDEVTHFVDAMRQAGITVNIVATLRPPQRAYLMHYSWLIANGQILPANVPDFVPNPGQAKVDICWEHHDSAGAPDDPASISAAQQMVAAFGIDPALGVAPALASLHTQGLAIDMTTTWISQRVTVIDGTGQPITINSHPHTGLNRRLIAIGATYGVIHFRHAVTDPNHWSVNGT